MTQSHSDQLIQKKGVGGWLLLFCLSLTVFGPLKTLITYVMSIENQLLLFDMYSGWKTVFIIDAT